MSGPATRAVLLAGGRGTRMRRPDADARLNDAQRSAAEAGLKVMVPDTRGRPFLDHVLTSLADAGIRDVAVIVPSEHDAIARHLRTYPPRRLAVTAVVQPEPLGTADALLAAERWCGRDPFLVLNADNLYPAEALTALVRLGEPGLIAFDPRALVAEGNIAPSRMAAYAVVRLRADDSLERLIEKPDADALRAAGPNPWVSMNLWRFDAGIFDACRDVPTSPRGEVELPQAVDLAVQRGMHLRAVKLHLGVLDLSRQGDVAAVGAALADRAVAT
jgi:glucose-1-phosphate thymidylyltransferase